MPLGAFYGSLAASASIFIGILSAYLVNTLANTRQEQAQLQRRQTQNENTLTTLRGQQDQYQSRIDEIKSTWHDREVDNTQNRVDHFVEYSIRSGEHTNPPENLSIDDIKQIFAEDQEYESVSELTEIEEKVLSEKRPKIEAELAIVTAEEFVKDKYRENVLLSITAEEMIKQFQDHYNIDNLWPVTRKAVARSHEREAGNRFSSSPHDLFRSVPVPPSITNASATATLKGQRKTRESAELMQNELRLIESKARIEEYEKQQEDINNRFESLSFSQARKTLRASGIAILASVVLPLLTYLCYELDVYLIKGTWLAPVTVFVVWLVGLVYVLGRLWQRVNENND